MGASLKAHHSMPLSLHARCRPGDGQSQAALSPGMVGTAAEVLAKLLVRASTCPALLEPAEALQVRQLCAYPGPLQLVRLPCTHQHRVQNFGS